MLTRRRFLKLSSMVGAGMLLPSNLLLGCGEEGGGTGITSTAARKTTRPASRIDRYIDPLPLPATLTPDGDKFPGSDYYEIRMSQFEQELHGQLPPTTVWGYEGNYPGPTIEARRGRPVRIKWINEDMPEKHLLEASLDPTIFQGHDYPDVRTVAHLHGGFTPTRFDGQPDMWSTPGGGETGPLYNPDDHVYGNDQPAASLWYHDHAMAITRLNVYAGMAGLYTIRDDTEDGLGLPAGDYEVPLVIQDKSLNEDASLYYPTQGVSSIHPVWVPTFVGDIAFVNGKAWPFLDVEPRRYRFRLLNASQTRTWNIRFNAGGQYLTFHVIGSDGGLLPGAAVPVQSLLMAPGERYDIIVDFAALGSDTVVTLGNDAPAPYPDGGGSVIDEVMQFRIGEELSGGSDSTPPEALRLPSITRFDTAGAPTRELVLEEIMEGDANLRMTINRKLFHDPVEEMPAAGSIEIWEFVNLSFNLHPVHLHLVHFQVLNRQLIDSTPYWLAWQDFNAGNAPRPRFADYLSGPVQPPMPYELGWKDTVIVMPNEITRLAVRFELPPDTPTPARYVYHCHILEHEDNEMMRPFEVV